MGGGVRRIFRVSPVVMTRQSVEKTESHHVHVHKYGHECPGVGYGLSSDCLSWRKF